MPNLGQIAFLDIFIILISYFWHDVPGYAAQHLDTGHADSGRFPETDIITPRRSSMIAGHVRGRRHLIMNLNAAQHWQLETQLTRLELETEIHWGR
jgi:hypothetical protein